MISLNERNLSLYISPHFFGRIKKLLASQSFILERIKWKKASWYCPFRLPGKVLPLDRLDASDPEPAGPGVHPLVDAVHVVAPISHILKQEMTTFKVSVLCNFGGFSHFLPQSTWRCRPRRCIRCTCPPHSCVPRTRTCLTTQSDSLKGHPFELIDLF